jgi:hypothetical protein
VSVTRAGPRTPRHWLVPRGLGEAAVRGARNRRAGAAVAAVAGLEEARDAPARSSPPQTRECGVGRPSSGALAARSCPRAFPPFPRRARYVGTYPACLCHGGGTTRLARRSGADWRASARADLRAYLAVLGEDHARTTVAQRLAAIRAFHRWATRNDLAPATRGARSRRRASRGGCHGSSRSSRWGGCSPSWTLTWRNPGPRPEARRRSNGACPSRSRPRGDRVCRRPSDQRAGGRRSRFTGPASR